MTRLVLHIGAPKTGTTYLQEFLAANTAQLRTYGIGYPEFCRHRNHTEFTLAARSVVGPLHRRHGITSTAAQRRLRTKVEREMRRLADEPGDSTIVTNEHLSQIRTIPELESLRELLVGSHQRIDVVLFLRRQDHLAGSFYGQAVKSGWTGVPGIKFVNRFAAEFDYQALIQRWQRVFGVDHVKVLPYLESYQANGDAVVDSVLTLLGIERDQAGTSAQQSLGSWIQPSKTINVRMSALATEYLRRFNPQVPRARADGSWNGEQRELLMAQLAQRFQGPSTLVTPEAMGLLLKRFDPHESIQAVFEASDVASESWDAWVDQSMAPTALTPVVSAEDFEEAKQSLFVPHGQIYPGGRRSGIGRRLARKVSAYVR